MPAPKITLPIFPPFQPPEEERTFQDWQREDDRERWIGRASLAECPEDPEWAGGNADDSGDPIDRYNSSRTRTIRVGPEAFIKYKGGKRSNSR